VISADWSKVIGLSTANASIEVWVEPPLRRGYSIHDQLFGALRALSADYAHFQPWSVFPRLAVAELKPPTNGKAFWDFSLMDPIAEDFMQATAKHPVIFDIGTLPDRMFRSKTPVVLSDNADEAIKTHERPYFENVRELFFALDMFPDTAQRIDVDFDELVAEVTKPAPAESEQPGDPPPTD
jgi:hypothetical protein